MSEKFYYLQIKEGPKGGPFVDVVHKWIAPNNPDEKAVIFSSIKLKEFPYKSNENVISEDSKSFIELFKNDDKKNDATLISIGENTDEHRDYLYIYQKNGTLQDLGTANVDIKNYPKIKPYEIDTAIGFKVKLICAKPIVECPLVLATLRSNQWLARGTFKKLEKPDNPEAINNSYFGNIQAIRYLIPNEKNENEKIKIKRSDEDGFIKYLECLSPIEFETLIAKIKEDEGYFVPAYKGGTFKDYDVICKSKDKNKVNEYIQVKLNLSKETYNKYKEKSDLNIYCIDSKATPIAGGPKVFDSKYIENHLKDPRFQKTKEWLKESLYWIDFDF